MDLNPTTTDTKRPRVKVKSPLKDASKPEIAQTPKPSRKTLTAARKKTPVVTVPTAPTPVDVETAIATTAFYLAADRGFAPGHDLEDWLEAERRIRAMYSLE